MTPETDDNYGLPAPVMSAMRALQQDQNRLTELFRVGLLSLRVPSPGRMTMAYTMANELVNHCQLLGVVIDELRRFRGEGDGAYQPAVRKPRDTGTLKPTPTIKKPPGGIGGSVSGRPPQKGPGFHALYREDGSLLGFVHDDYRVRIQREAPMRKKKPAKKKPAKKKPAKKPKRGVPYREALSRLHDDVSRPVQSPPKELIRRRIHTIKDFPPTALDGCRVLDTRTGTIYVWRQKKQRWLKTKAIYKGSL